MQSLPRSPRRHSRRLKRLHGRVGALTARHVLLAARACNQVVIVFDVQVDPRHVISNGVRPVSVARRLASGAARLVVAHRLKGHAAINTDTLLRGRKGHGSRRFLGAPLAALCCHLTAVFVTMRRAYLARAAVVGVRLAADFTGVPPGV